MEKAREEKKNQFPKSSSARYDNNSLWDCGSTLYDSFEFNSFKRQLDSAISNSQSHIQTTLSMSHLPEQQQQASSAKKPSYKFSRRSFQKFLRSVFKSSSNKSNVTSTTTKANSFQVAEKYSKERFYVVYDKSGSVLSTIPEGDQEFEIASLSPEISSLIKRSASERFTTTGVACA